MLHSRGSSASALGSVQEEQQRAASRVLEEQVAAARAADAFGEVFAREQPWPGCTPTKRSTTRVRGGGWPGSAEGR